MTGVAGTGAALLLRSAAAALLLGLAACGALRDAMERDEAKFCGRDFGDRIHWTPVPYWFRSIDCARSSPDALWSDLYVGCYGRDGRWTYGRSQLVPPEPNRCGWDRFDPAELGL